MGGPKKPPPPCITGTQIYPAEDRVNGLQPWAWHYSFRTGGCQWLRPESASVGNGTGSVKHSQSYARGQGVASILTNLLLAGSVNHSFTEDSGVPEWVKENGPVRGGCALVKLYMFLPGFSSHPDGHKQYMVICKSFTVHTPSPLGVDLWVP